MSALARPSSRRQGEGGMAGVVGVGGAASSQEKLERKRQFDRKCECDRWDFLAGVGPSAIREQVRRCPLRRRGRRR